MAIYLALHRPFPPDTTPEGAYLRVALAIGQDKPKDMFAYLETEAQWACFTLSETKRETYDLVSKYYAEPERTRLMELYKEDASAGDGPHLFALYTKKRGFDSILRRDLSGISHVDRSKERATVVTVRGTRYSFRIRENGIWGLTLFTPKLLAEAKKASRDLEMIKQALDK